MDNVPFSSRGECESQLNTMAGSVTYLFHTQICLLLITNWHGTWPSSKDIK